MGIRRTATLAAVPTLLLGGLLGLTGPSASATALMRQAAASADSTMVLNRLTYLAPDSIRADMSLTCDPSTSLIVELEFEQEEATGSLVSPVLTCPLDGTTRITPVIVDDTGEGFENGRAGTLAVTVRDGDGYVLAERWFTATPA